MINDNINLAYSVNTSGVVFHYLNFNKEFHIVIYEIIYWDFVSWNFS